MISRSFGLPVFLILIFLTVSACQPVRCNEMVSGQGHAESTPAIQNDKPSEKSASGGENYDDLIYSGPTSARPGEADKIEDFKIRITEFSEEILKSETLRLLNEMKGSAAEQVVKLFGTECISRNKFDLFARFFRENEKFLGTEEICYAYSGVLLLNGRRQGLIEGAGFLEDLFHGKQAALFPHHRNPFLINALNMYMALENSEKVLQLIAQIPEDEFVKNLDFGMFRARAHIINKNVDKAIESLDLVIAQTPYFKAAFLLRARVMFDNGRYGDAIMTGRRAVELGGFDLEFMTIITDSLERMGESARALKCCQQILKRVPDSLDSRKSLLRLLLKEGRYDETVREYVSYFGRGSISDNDAEMIYSEALFNSGRVAAALSAGRSLKKLGIFDDRLDYLIARCLESLEKSREARVIYSDLLARNSPFARGFIPYVYGRAVYLYLTGRWGNAIELISKISEQLKNLPPLSSISEKGGLVFLKSDVSESDLGIFRDKLENFYLRKAEFYDKPIESGSDRFALAWLQNERGVYFFGAKKYSVALEKFQKALDTGVLSDHALCIARENELSSSMAVADMNPLRSIGAGVSISSSPSWPFSQQKESPLFLATSGNSLVERGDTEKARDVYKKLLKTLRILEDRFSWKPQGHPVDMKIMLARAPMAQALINMAQINLSGKVSSDDLSNARGFLRMARTFEPTSDEIFLIQSMEFGLAMDANDLNEAGRVFASISNPERITNGPFQKLYSVYLEKRGDFRAAAQATLRYREISGDAASVERAGQLFLAAGEYQLAEKWLQQAFDSGAVTRKGVISLAQSMVRLSKSQEAIALLQNYMKTHVQANSDSDSAVNGDFKYALGKAFLIAGKYDEADKELSEALNLKNGDLKIALDLAELQRYRNTPEALRILEESLDLPAMNVLDKTDNFDFSGKTGNSAGREKYNDYKKAMTLAAILAAETGQIEKAGQYTAIVLQKGLADPRMVLNLANLHLELGNVKLAGELAGAIRSSDPDDLEGILLDIRILESAGKMAEANENLDAALMKYRKPSDQVLLLYQKARHLVLLGDLAGARKKLDEYLASGGSKRGVSEIEELMEKKKR